jgi:hypothetical protein
VQGSFSKLSTFMLVPSYTSPMVEEALIFITQNDLIVVSIVVLYNVFLKNHSPWKVVDVQTTI